MSGNAAAKCVYCGRPAETRDHVPPKGVFVPPRPNNLVTVPACRACNAGAQHDDEYFRWFVSTGSPRTEKADELMEMKVLPQFRRRPGLLHQIMSGTRNIDVYSEGGIYLRTEKGFEFDRDRVQRVTDRIVRGLYAHHLGEPLGAESSVGSFALDPNLDDCTKEAICTLQRHDVGEEVFSYRYYIDDDDARESYWFLLFFHRTLLFTRTEPNH